MDFKSMTDAELMEYAAKRQAEDDYYLDNTTVMVRGHDGVMSMREAMNLLDTKTEVSA